MAYACSAIETYIHITSFDIEIKCEWEYLSMPMPFHSNKEKINSTFDQVK